MQVLSNQALEKAMRRAVSCPLRARWLVFSAAVIRQTNDLEMVSCLKEVRTVLQKAPKTPLHFVDLKHEQQVPYIRHVGEFPLRTVRVLIYKPLIREPEKFQNTKEKDNIVRQTGGKLQHSRYTLSALFPAEPTIG